MRKMDTTTFYEVMVTEFDKARQLLSERSGELSYVFVILSLTLVFACGTVREFAAWKIQLDSRETTSNWMIFFGQLFLAVGVLCTIKSIESFRIHILHSFMLSVVACYCFSGSAFLSYDLIRPPSRTLGVFLCVSGVGCLTAALYCEYNGLWIQLVATSSMLGLNLLSYGVAFVALNVLDEEYRRYQYVYWRNFFQRTTRN